MLTSPKLSKVLIILEIRFIRLAKHSAVAVVSGRAGIAFRTVRPLRSVVLLLEAY